MNERNATKIFCTNLKRILGEKGLSQAELARRLEITPQAISNWLVGKNLPAFTELDGICKVVGCRYEDLFHEDDHNDDCTVEELLGSDAVTVRTRPEEPVSCEDHLQKNFQKNLRRRLETAGISQAELGRHIGATPQTVSKYMKGQARPRMRMMEKIAKVLGCTAVELIGEESLDFGREDDMASIIKVLEDAPDDYVSGLRKFLAETLPLMKKEQNR